MGRFFWMLRSDTRAMGRVLDVVWYDLNVTKAKGSVTYPLDQDDSKKIQYYNGIATSDSCAQ